MCAGYGEGGVKASVGVGAGSGRRLGARQCRSKRRARGVGRGQEVCDVELISCDGELLIFWSCVGCMVTARGDSDPGAGAGDDHLLASGVRS